MVRRFLAGVLAALLFAAGGLAEVKIPQNKRVRNYESGVCVWCAIENLGNVHNIKQMEGIAKYRHENYGNKLVYIEAMYMMDAQGNLIQIMGPHWVVKNEAPGTPDRVRHELARLNVKYKMQTHRDFSTDIIDEAVKNDWGCAVGLKDYPEVGDYHMVTLTDLTEDKFIFVDNNGGCDRIEMSREWFFEHWTGYTIMIFPEKTK